MKKSIILLLAASFAAFGCSTEKSETAAKEETVAKVSFDELAASGKFAKAEISVPTIQCQSCVMKVESGIKEVEGVQDYKVDLGTKTAFVLYDESMTDVPSIEKSIAMEGYDANETKRDAEAFDNLEKCCKVTDDSESH